MLCFAIKKKKEKNPMGHQIIWAMIWVTIKGRWATLHDQRFLNDPRPQGWVTIGTDEDGLKCMAIVF